MFVRCYYFGCQEYHIKTELELHAEYCKYKEHICPCKPGDCSWRGTFPRFLKHYESKHKDLVWRESSFKIDVVNNIDKNYLFVHKVDLFIIQLKYDVKECTLWYAVRYVGLKENAELFFYEIVLSGPEHWENKFIAKKQVKPYEIFIADCAPCFQVDTAAHNVAFTCTVSILPHEKHNNFLSNNTEASVTSHTDEQMLRELECPICKDYMVPPIHQCVAGHSFCTSCESHLNNCCPICRETIDSERNYVLEKLIPLFVKFPCKYRSYYCPFISNLLQMKHHVKDCTYRPVTCPLKTIAGCSWEGSLTNIIIHVRESHADNVWDVDVKNVDLEKNIFIKGRDDYSVIIAFDQVFILYFNYNNCNYQWNVQYVGAKNEAKQYMYKLIIVDDLKQRLSVKRICGVFTDDREVFVESSVVLSEELLIPLISHTYKCRILKI